MAQLERRTHPGSILTPRAAAALVRRVGDALKEMRQAARTAGDVELWESLTDVTDAAAWFESRRAASAASGPLLPKVDDLLPRPDGGSHGAAHGESNTAAGGRLSADAAAAVVGVSGRAIRAAASHLDGRLRGDKVGGCWCFTRAAVDEFAEWRRSR